MSTTNAICKISILIKYIFCKMEVYKSIIYVLRPSSYLYLANVGMNTSAMPSIPITYKTWAPCKCSVLNKIDRIVIELKKAPEK